LEGEVWIGIAFAKQYRLMLAFLIDAQEPSLAEPLVDRTEGRLRGGSWPVWVSDGMDAYGEALKNRHCILQTYPRTGKRGRPRRDKLVACPRLRYGQVVKERDGRHRVIGVFKRSRYGEIPLNRITTVHIERHNLSLRQENRRLNRKTIAFSKTVTGLTYQLLLYQGYYHFVRPHQGLRLRIPPHETGRRKWQPRTPAVAAGLTDHIWSLEGYDEENLYQRLKEHDPIFTTRKNVSELKKVGAGCSPPKAGLARHAPVNPVLC
jgi:IS1 family transposase